jgi:hypothetical protein
MNCRVVLLALTILATPGLFAETPATAPVLRLETGMHTGAIKSLSVDADGRLLLTASTDHTARLWEAATGRLLLTLRPPMGEGGGDRLTAGALSPDGHLAALGEQAGAEGGNPGSIFLFDTATGQCLRRIPGLPSAIQHLAFSRDGARLVACLGGAKGIRVFSPGEGRVLFEDMGYGDGSFGADFDGLGRLATSSWDGFIRLYDPEGHLLAKSPAPGGERPHGLAFSPDGTRLAVGFAGMPSVQVLAAPSLQTLFKPDNAGTNRNLVSVAWSRDGQTLFAGGRFNQQGKCPIRSWADGGRGSTRDLATEATDTIWGLATTPSGGVLWASADPAWGQLGGAAHTGANVDFGVMNLGTPGDKGGRHGRHGGNAKVSLGGMDLALDQRGTSLSFCYVRNGSDVRFELPGRRLGPDQGPSLSLPQTEGLPIRWKNVKAPTLGGQALIPEFETSRSLAITQGRFLLGTEWYLRCFDTQGKRLWAHPAPGVVGAVNISTDGTLGVAAYGDGTIRWHRMSDGRELLAFFPHADQKRWVLWTPSGYYDCSPGAEDLIGWQVNRGEDQAADFFPVSRFRSTYYRPDVIDKVLESLDEGAAIAAANTAAGGRIPTATVEQLLPPVVSILSPGFGSTFSQGTLSMKVSVRPPRGKAIDSVWAAVDGRRVEMRSLRPQQDQSGSENLYTLEVPLPPQDCTVSVFAQSGAAISEATSLRLSWAGKVPTPGVGTPGEAVSNQPKLYLLAIGISKYQQNDLSLDYPAKDARDLTAVFLAQKQRLYRDVEAKVLVDGEASKEAVIEGLEWLEKEATPKDVAALFLAGHGLIDPAGDYYFLPCNADPAHIKSTMVSGNEFQSTLANLPGKALLFLDSCYSGNVLKVKLRGLNDLGRFVNELSSAENGVVVFSASTGRQASQESSEWGNRAFTKALVEGLSGKADAQKTGRVTINMLDLYVSERVKELTQGTQAPTTTKPSAVPDFPIAVTK